MVFGRFSSVALRLSALVLLAVIPAGCGKKGPPLPPLIITPGIVRDLTVRQEGAHFVLYFTEPTLNSDGTPMVDLKRIDIYRIAEDRPPAQTQPAAPQSQPAGAPPAPPVAPPVIPEVMVEDFASRAATIGSIEIEKMAEHRAGPYIVYIDELERFQPPRGFRTRFTYAVQPFNKKGRGPGFSNRQTLDLAGLADPVKDLKAAIQEIGVVLTWTPPATNIDGSSPPAIFGYNVYRRTSDATAFGLDPMNPSPVPTPLYLDPTITAGTTYTYAVKGTKSPNRPYQESAWSNEVEVTPKDVFAPKPPLNLVAVASKSGVNLLWTANQEKDLAGYRVYRRSGDGTYTSLSEGLIAKNTYMDTTVKSKTTYFYVVTAVDRSVPPNESAYSNEAKEYVP